MHSLFKTSVTWTVGVNDGGPSLGNLSKRCLEYGGVLLGPMLAASMISTSEI